MIYSNLKSIDPDQVDIYAKSYYILNLKQTKKEDGYFIFSYWETGGRSPYKEALEKRAIAEFEPYYYRPLYPGELLVHSIVIESYWVIDDKYDYQHQIKLPITEKTLELMELSFNDLSN